MTLALDSVEASIADILLTHKRRMPEKVLNKIMDYVYKCNHARALWGITLYLDAFDAVDYSRIVHSWDLLLRYETMMLAKFESDRRAEGRNVSPYTLECIEESRKVLQSCVEGKKKAMRVKDSQQVTSRNKQIQSFKAKCN